MVGEEKGVEDKAGEMRAQPRESQKGPLLSHTGYQTATPAQEDGGRIPPFTSTTGCVTSGKALPLWASKTAGFSRSW